MKTCDKNHSEIAYNEEKCPLCAEIRRHREFKNQIERVVNFAEKASAEIRTLVEEITKSAPEKESE